MEQNLLKCLQDITAAAKEHLDCLYDADEHIHCETCEPLDDVVALQEAVDASNLLLVSAVDKPESAIHGDQGDLTYEKKLLHEALYFANYTPRVVYNGPMFRDSYELASAITQNLKNGGSSRSKTNRA